MTKKEVIEQIEMLSDELDDYESLTAIDEMESANQRVNIALISLLKTNAAKLAKSKNAETVEVAGAIVIIAEGLTNLFAATLKQKSKPKRR